jgi:hypothetical protein
MSSENGGGEYRCLCLVTAEKFEARIASLGSEDQTALQIHEIQLNMGPSIAVFGDSEHEMEMANRSFDALFHEPQLRDLIASGSSQGRETSLSARIGYPHGFFLSKPRAKETVPSRVISYRLYRPQRTGSEVQTT